MRKVIWGLLLSLLSQGAPGQDDFDQWRKHERRAFERHVEQQNKAFRDKLETDWREFQRFQAFERDATPKPPRQPRVRDALKGDPSEQRPPTQASALPGDFLGHELEPVDWAVPELADFLARPDATAVARAYDRLRASEHRPVLQWLDKRTKHWRLNDWARLRLVRRLTARYGEEPDVRRFLTWFLLLRSGHDVRLGYHEDGLLLLFNTREKVFERDYYRLGGAEYYDLFGQGASRLSIYERQRPRVRPLTLGIDEHPVTRPRWRERVLDDGRRRLSLRFDAQLAAFYNGYPLLALRHYFAAPLEPGLARSLSSEWAKQPVSGESPSAQLNAMLSLLQHGLPYATDQEQFGMETNQLPSQSLLNPAADCEDRSFLLAGMVQRLLNLPVIGLDYPGHVALAVGLKTDGDSVRHGGRAYVVADPTYLGARLGQGMPRFRDSDPAIIPAEGGSGRGRANMERRRDP